MIDIWINGRLDIRVIRETAEAMAGYLYGKGWGVRWMPEIGILALFSPEKKA